MPDELLRAAERRAVAGGLEVQARALVERLRRAPACKRCEGSGRYAPPDPTGVIPRERTDGLGVPCRPCAGTGSPLRARVELAAYCGDEAARAALGGWPCCHFHSRQGMHEKFPCVDKPPTLPSLVGGLSRWADVGHAPGWVLVRAAAAAARVAVEASWAGGADFRRRARAAGVDLRERYAEKDLAMDALAAGEAWVACPCREHEIPVMDVAGDGRREIHYSSAWWAWAVCRAIVCVPHERERLCREAIAEAARDPHVGEAPVRDAIRSALVAWALGGAA
jgi:hypothetical protein